MFVIFKNGTKWHELPSYAEACKLARLDAVRHHMSGYAIFAKEETDKEVRGEIKKPLYRVTNGVRYIIPNPPINAAA